MVAIATTILVFVFIAGLLLWFVIGAAGKWFLKAGTIILVPLLSMAIWSTIESYQGWPTPKEPPTIFRFLGAVVYPPDKQREYDGDIFIWLLALGDSARMQKIDEEKKPWDVLLSLLEYNPRHEPRAHKIPYSEEMADLMAEAQEKTKRGKIVYMKRLTEKKEGDENTEGEPNGDEQGGERGFWNTDKQKFEFYDLPPPKYPPKIPK